MPNDHGFDTRDLLALGASHPAERELTPQQREDASQATGRRCRVAGTTILVGAVLTALSCALLTEHQVFRGISAQILAALSLFALIALGSLLASAGWHERNDQPQRAMGRLAIAKTYEMAASLAELVEQGKADAERLDGLDARLADLEERVDAVGAAIDRVAEYLPEDQQIQNWRGFNSAVKKGFLEEPTSTDGVLPPRKHPSGGLGLVPRDSSTG